MDYFIQNDLQALALARGVFHEGAAQQQLTALSEAIASRNRLPSLLLEEVGRPRPAATFDIFLSYSSKDSLAVLGLYLWFNNRGYSVYIDCFDSALPNSAAVTRTTASVLRRRMVQSKCLFVATTQDTPSSTWVPWELGFTDGLTNKAAVLYIARSSGVSFNRQSYFELYPEVRHNPRRTKPNDLVLVDSLDSPPFPMPWGNWLGHPKRY